MHEKPLRILQVIGIMNRGGAETMIMNLYRNIDREKVQFDFVENSTEHAAFDDEIQSLGGRIYRCPHYTGKNHFQYVKWWNDFFKEHAGEYSIVHGHIGSTAAFYLAAAKRYGLFTIAHSHNTKGALTARGMLYRIMTYPTRHIADYFFACSEQAGIDRFGRRITRNTKRYKILNNAIDTSVFSFDFETKKAVRLSLGVLEDDFVVGHVGRFMGQKNHTFLIDIFYEIHKRDPKAKLLLVGDGPLREQIQQKVKKLSLEESVIFTGIRSDVSELMQAMDVFLFPSIFEGLPVTLVEAQSSGLPCIISNSIPKDTVIVQDLIIERRLDETPEEWAASVLSCRNKERTDRVEDIKNRGFDISETSGWMEAFYLDKAR